MGKMLPQFISSCPQLFEGLSKEKASFLESMWEWKISFD